jgi:hypothetical protein
MWRFGHRRNMTMKKIFAAAAVAAVLGLAACGQTPANTVEAATNGAEAVATTGTDVVANGVDAAGGAVAGAVTGAGAAVAGAATDVAGAAVNGVDAAASTATNAVEGAGAMATNAADAATNAVMPAK